MNKNRKKPSPSTRKPRSSKRGGGAFVVCALIVCLLAIGIYGFVRLFGDEYFKESTSSPGKKSGNSLVSDDETLYRKFQNSNRKQELKSPGSSNKIRDDKPVEKVKVRPQQYEDKDRDYLNKIIHSR